MLEGIEYLLDFSAVLLWAVGICQERLTGNKKRWAAGGGLLLGILVWSAFCRTEIEIALINSLSIIAYMFLIEEEPVRKVAVCLFSNYYLRILYEPVKLLVDICAEYWRAVRPYSDPLIALLVAVCTLLCARWVRKREARRRWIKEEISTKHYFIGFLCAFTALGVTSYIELEIEDRNLLTKVLVGLLTITVDIFFYALGIVAAVVHSYFRHYKEESALKDEYLRLSQKHFESISNNIREVRSLRHDMRAHLNVISYLAGEKNWEKLEEYLESVEDAVESSVRRFVNVNHELVNAILTDALAGKEDIRFQYEGIIPQGVRVEDFDLCTVFSNLISNSLEACQRLKTEEKEISLKIQSLQGNLYIRMENPVEEEVDIKKLGEWTTKADRTHHGYGVQNIRTAVEKYQGELAFVCEEHRFSAEIIFWDALGQQSGV